jgi:succinate dehydrogenase/fumarate reductase flavoprotein subunit
MRSNLDDTSVAPTNPNPGRVTRRRLLQGAGAAAFAASPAITTYRGSRAYAAGSWDQETDVVVVGGGAAGLSAAVIAAELGSQVIILEKASGVGGTAAKSDRGFWIPNNAFQREMGIADSRDAALSYMARYSYPQLFNPSALNLGLPDHEYSLLTTYYDRAASTIETLERLGALHSTIGQDWTGKPYPDYLAQLQADPPVLGRTLYPTGTDGERATGVELISGLKAAAAQRSVQTLAGRRVARLVLNDEKQVVGVEATITSEGEATPSADDAIVTIRAKKAVIFASGGFTHNPGMVRNFQRGLIFGGYAVPSNEGDFIRVAGAIGAKFGNMQSAFSAEVVVEQALKQSSVTHNVFAISGDSFLMVNKLGRRVTNEKANYDSRAEAHFVWDSMRGEWVNYVLMLVYDQRQADYFAGFFPFPAKDGRADYVIFGQTLDELSASIDERLLLIANRTGGVQLDPDFAANLRSAVDRFNAFAKAGKDEDYQRGEAPYDLSWATIPPDAANLPDGVSWPSADQLNPTMYPLSDTGPYYAMLVGAGTLDTNGGPVINANAQVLDNDDQPISGLYAAGNCVASPCADAYWSSGGALAAALIFGAIAGENAHSEAEKPV